MADRGDYSPIARVLRDGPDFQRLSTAARHVFIDLKIAFGPCGIEVCYPDALVLEITHTTGYPGATVRAALDELEAADWIARELNVVWVIGQLEFHPNMTPKLPKHRAGVQNHVRGLPRLAIVRRFIDRYAAYFAGVDDPGKGYPMASESPPPAPPPAESTDDAGRTEDGSDEPLASAYPSDFARAWELYPKRENNPKKAALKAWKARVRAGVAAADMLAGVVRYAAYCVGKGIVGTDAVMQARTFFGPDERWKDEYRLTASHVGSAAQPQVDRARVLYRICRTYGLLSFATSAKNENRRRLDLAKADPDAGETFEAEILRVKPWERVIAEASDEREAVDEIARRLAVHAVPAAPMDRARVWLAVAKECDLLAFSGNREQYEANRARARESGRLGDAFDAEWERVRLWDRIGTLPGHLAVLEIAARLSEHAAAPAA